MSSPFKGCVSLTQFPPFASEYESKALIEALVENFVLLEILLPATFHYNVLRRDQIGREEICQVRGKRSGFKLSAVSNRR